MQRPETKARARALQLLYSWELAGRPPIATVIARVAGMYGTWVASDDRAADLARRATQSATDLDARLARLAEHWRLERVGLVERSILRLALARRDITWLGTANASTLLALVQLFREHHPQLLADLRSGGFSLAHRVPRNLRRDEELSRPALNRLTAKSYVNFWRAELAAFNQKVAE